MARPLSSRGPADAYEKGHKAARAITGRELSAEILERGITVAVSLAR